MKLSKRVPSVVLCGLGLLACARAEVSPPVGGGASGGSEGGGQAGAGGGGGKAGKDGTSGAGGKGGSGPGLQLPDAAGEAAAPKECGRAEFMLDRIPPELLLVLDRSSSMARTIGLTARTLWDDTLAGLDEVLKTTDRTTFWGLRMFPNPSGCNVAAAIEVPLGLNNHMAILNAARTLGPNPATGMLGTPTQLVMQRAVEDLRMRDTKTSKYIVLATDGDPTCPREAPLATQLANGVAGVKEAADAGFKSYVVGIGIKDIDETTLNRYADAGGLPRNDPKKYYPVENKEELINVFREITGLVDAKCDFPLTTKPLVPDGVKVSIDGEPVPQDPTNGWSYADPQLSKIQLNGAACEKFKAKSSKLKVVYPCVNE